MRSLKCVSHRHSLSRPVHTTPANIDQTQALDTRVLDFGGILTINHMSSTLSSIGSSSQSCWRKVVFMESSSQTCLAVMMSIEDHAISIRRSGPVHNGR